ncbi:secreted protein [Candidatus Magnetobacterium bavaricum]|uniref:Secreted protein n=1 Tax=Candidatus Magnetobacterium bavaricum TaxID=29290 RepID=A0A0F3GQZ4_9BACT|nr:secreted protein [Candidatus Magnetobacterium bavaricum]
MYRARLSGATSSCSMAICACAMASRAAANPSTDPRLRNFIWLFSFSGMAKG